MADAQKKEEAKDSKADAAPAEGTAAASGGKKKLIIIIAAALVVLLGGGGAAFFMLSGGSDKHGEAPAEDGGHEAASDSEAKKADAKGGHGEAKKEEHGKEAAPAHGEEAKDEHGKAKGDHGEAKKEEHGEAKGGHGEAKKDEKGKEAETGEKKADDSSGFGETYAFKPFHLNLGNPLENHYVRLEVAIEYKGGATQKEEIEKRLPQLRDAVVSVASRKSREFLLGPDGKDQLRREILIRVNRYMGKPVESVYITDILIE